MYLFSSQAIPNFQSVRLFPFPFYIIFKLKNLTPSNYNKKSERRNNPERPISSLFGNLVFSLPIWSSFSLLWCPAWLLQALTIISTFTTTINAVVRPLVSWVSTTTMYVWRLLARRKHRVSIQFWSKRTATVSLTFPISPERLSSWVDVYANAEISSFDIFT